MAWKSSMSKRRCGARLAFVMERAGTKLQFLPDLRESVLPPVEPGKVNPRLVLAK